MSDHNLRSYIADDIPRQLANVEELLQFLGGPAVITQPGADPSRSRAIVTLLHGNEPSGAKAIYRWLMEDHRPAVNSVFVIASVPTALTPPVFSHRMLPAARDLNRCFRPPYGDHEGQLALDILDALRAHSPEALIDVHNTSGTGPAFGVAISDDRNHDALITPFAQRLIITDLRLGALMEISESDFPTVTVECGGNQDPESDQIAWDGIYRYLTEANILEAPGTDIELEKLNNPVRLELCAGCTLTYADEPQPDVDLTLKPDLEHYNFGTVPAGTALGWLGVEGLAALTARDPTGHERLEELYCTDGRHLQLAKPMKLFMITTNPQIAERDCLWYSTE